MLARTLEILQGSHIFWAHRAVVFAIAQLSCNKGNLLFYAYTMSLSVTINQNAADAFVSDRFGLKLSRPIGSVLTSRQIRWSPNFSRTIDSDALGKWGQRSSLAALH